MAYDIIIDIGQNTPAEKAGFQTNDELLEPNQLAPDMYPVGTVVHVKIKRQGREMTIPVKISRICNE
jgi:predicted metalloprotease with PDZ domain